ncbi:hypothetical protein ES703_49182 [subsurface metagenome]
MFGGIISGIGGLIGGAGTLVGGLAGGIGTLFGGVTQFAGEVIGAAPEIISAAKPGIELVSQWKRQRAEEEIYREATELQRQRLDAEKQIALQQLLLANQPAQPVTYQIIPGEPVTAPVQTAPGISTPMLGQAVSPKQDNTILILIVAAIAICFLLFMKK